MDPLLEELYRDLHRVKFNDQKVPALAANNPVNAMKLQQPISNLSFANPPLISQNPNFNLVVPSVVAHDVESSFQEGFDLSDVVLKYINQVLMEEDEELKGCLYHEPFALEETEKTLYEAIGKQYPSPQDPYNLPHINHDSWNVNVAKSRMTGRYSGTSSSASGLMDPTWPANPNYYNPLPIVDFSVSSSNLASQTSYSTSSNSGRQYDVRQFSYDSSISSSSNGISLLRVTKEDSPVSTLNASGILNGNGSILQFHRGIEEASKLIPKGPMYKGLMNNCLEGVGPINSVTLLENRLENEISSQLPSGRKYHDRDESQLEEKRGNKQSASSFIPEESVVRSEMWDKVLLCSKGKNDAALREELQSELNRNAQNVQQNGGKGRGRRKGNKRQVVDLRSLLSLCAQAVGLNDQRSANDLLKQIRQHSSPTGDGNQRLAHYFANGLEARLAGAGTPIYNSLLTGPASAVDILRAYHMFLAVCPFKKIANFFSNRTITEVAEKAARLHIIDIGLVYGFQYPCLFQRISSRVGGPPKIRITGIDLPQPGFRPAKRLEETGRRLKSYAESFNIPFEFNAVAKKWETVTIEDLKLDSDEVLVVNGLFRFKYIPEETAMVECPRDMVLNLIRQINPAVFIQGVVNGAYNSPFFNARFREALFHFSTIFDMFETNVPRDFQERTVMEREIFGRQAMNVIACEGLERIERPETYKQWQVRNERAGFKQLPLNREIVDMAKRRVKSVYHKDFSLDEDGHWLLLDWKGRILYTVTTWKPVSEDHNDGT